MPSLQIIYASTSGHTEFVIDMLCAFLRKKNSNLSIERVRAELAKPEDLVKGDVLLLATSTWNTGGIEGQLNPHMHALLKEKAAAIDLNGKKVILVALGDSRYRYTAGSSMHLEEFVRTHNGVLLGETFKLVNEPYGQEKMIEQWSEVLLSKLSTR